MVPHAVRLYNRMRTFWPWESWSKHSTFDPHLFSLSAGIRSSARLVPFWNSLGSSRRKNEMNEIREKENREGKNNLVGNGLACHCIVCYSAFAFFFSFSFVLFFFSDVNSELSSLESCNGRKICCVSQFSATTNTHVEVPGIFWSIFYSGDIIQVRNVFRFTFVPHFSELINKS